MPRSPANVFADPLDAELHSADGQSATSQNPGPSAGSRRPRPLTTAQENVLRFICEEFEENGVLPSLREIADHFGWTSTTAVIGHMDALRRKGFLAARNGRRLRCYRILRLPDGTPVRVRLIPIV